MTKILLIKQHTVIYDDADDEFIQSHSWSIEPRNSVFYVRATGICQGKKRPWLHRALLSPPQTMVVDHINHDGLDNRRENLRLATPAENARNARSLIKKYKGVWAHSGGFKAGVKFERKHVYAGWAKTEEQAARLYDAKALELHGKFACLNFPDEPPVVRIDYKKRGGPNSTAARKARSEARQATWL